MALASQWTVAASATKLSTILGADTRGFCTIKNAKDAANKLYIGGASVTNVPANAGIELAAGESVALNLDDESADDIYLVGTVAAANIAFIWVD